MLSTSTTTFRGVWVGRSGLTASAEAVTAVNDDGHGMTSPWTVVLHDTLQTTTTAGSRSVDVYTRCVNCYLPSWQAGQTVAQAFASAPSGG